MEITLNKPEITDDSDHLGLKLCQDINKTEVINVKNILAKTEKQVLKYMRLRKV